MSTTYFTEQALSHGVTSSMAQCGSTPFTGKELCCPAPAEDWAVQAAQQLPETKGELTTFPEAEMENVLLKTRILRQPNSDKNHFSL